jgi:hypothetical protein
MEVSLTRHEPETETEEDTPGVELESNRRKRFVAWAVRWHTPLLVIGALVSLALVVGVGSYQFSHRARVPIDIVRTQPVHGTDVNVGDGILDFVKSQGIKVVTEGFKPSFGAEQVGDDEWVVSYVYEVGRQSNRLSWRVNTRTGDILPRSALSRRILDGQ